MFWVFVLSVGDVLYLVFCGLVLRNFAWSLIIESFMWYHHIIHTCTGHQPHAISPGIMMSAVSPFFHSAFSPLLQHMGSQQNNAHKSDYDLVAIKQVCFSGINATSLSDMVWTIFLNIWRTTSIVLPGFVPSKPLYHVNCVAPGRTRENWLFPGDSVPLALDSVFIALNWSSLVLVNHYLPWTRENCGCCRHWL